MAINEFNLSYPKYQGHARTRFRVPPRVLVPFINADPQRYEKLRRAVRKGDRLPGRLHWRRYHARVDDELYRKVRHAYDRACSYSQRYFPAYGLFWPQFLSAEWLAAVEWRKYHRDHMVHQVLTAYVGSVLLQGGPNCVELKTTIAGGVSSTLLEHMIEIVLNHDQCKYLREYAREMGVAGNLLEPNDLARHIWRNLILDTFFIAAMFHDMGYPWQFVNRIHEGLEAYDPLENPVAGGVDWVAERYRERLVLYPLNGYERTDPSRPGRWWDEFRTLVGEGLTKTHGMPSAIALLHLNDTLRGFPVNSAPALRRFCIEWAAMAVMMHDMLKLYGEAKEVKSGGFAPNVVNGHLQLRFERDPLSCILALSDVVEDFERCDATFSREPKHDNPHKYKPVPKYKPQCQSVKIAWCEDTRELTITYSYENPYSRHNKLGHARKEEVGYFHPNRGFVDMSYGGISRIRLAVSP